MPIDVLQSVRILGMGTTTSVRNAHLRGAARLATDATANPLAKTMERRWLQPGNPG